MKYKHEENQIDPRDKSLVTYVSDKKIFITEASSLHGSGISPENTHYVIGGQKWTIWMWSERFQMSILYVWSHTIKDRNGDVAVDVFKPRFDMICTLRETNAHAASRGTELYILND